MPLPKLLLDIPQEGLTIREAEGAVLRAKTSSGASRIRLDHANAPLEGDLQLMMHPGAYTYWRAFWRTSIRQGSLPFLADLIIEDSDPEECTVKFIPGSYSHAVTGYAHMVSLQIEITRPAQPSAADDQAIIDSWENYGEYGANVYDLLAKLVNVDFPASLG